MSPSESHGPRAVSRDRPLNMTTGPVEVSPAVLQAQMDSFLTPHSEDFWRLHDDTLGKLADLLSTSGKVLAFHGSIRAGLDIALANMVVPGMKVLAISNGYWGTLIGQYAARYGAEIEWLREQPLEPVRVDAVRQALADNPDVGLVTVVQVETNSGVLNPIAEIGAMVREHGALYYVDTGSSAGAMPLETDLWGVDIAVTGSHKCLCSVPGLAVVTLSDRAWQAIRSHQDTLPGTYYNLANLFERTVTRPEVPPYTQPTTLFWALHTAIAELAGIGHDRWREQHQEAASQFREAMRASGLRMLLDGAGGAAIDNREAVFSDTVMAVELPEGVDVQRVRHVMATEFGIYVLGNLGEFADRSIRVGLMSPQQLEPGNLRATIEAIPRAVARVRGA